MRSIIFIVALGLLGNLASAQDIMQPEKIKRVHVVSVDSLKHQKIANEIAISLAEGNFKTSRKHFDATLSKALNEKS